ncbi:unnamed protein product, partial [Gordionus sp. m RMFG-2023]
VDTLGTVPLTAPFSALYAQLTEILKPCGLSTENSIRPDELTLIPWSNGTPLAWDYICIVRFAPSFSKNSFVRAENSKINKYISLTNCNLIPNVSDTTGFFGNHALTFFKSLGKKIRAITGDPQEGFYLRHRVLLTYADLIVSPSTALFFDLLPPNI